MATAALVDKDLDIGREILRALATGRIEVNVAFWAYVPQSSEWELFIATPLVDTKGPKAAYEEVLNALHDAGMDPYLPWRKLFLRSPKAYTDLLTSWNLRTSLKEARVPITLHTCPTPTRLSGLSTKLLVTDSLRRLTFTARRGS